MKIESILPSREKVEQALDRKVNNLPAFPVVALKVMQLIEKDTASAMDLARIIESDPAVTAKVLRLVNSAAFGLANPVSSVKEGITYAGVPAIRKLALQVTLFEKIIRPRKTVIFDRTFFWQHCLAVAGLGMAMAEQIGYPRPEEAYVAGLLHDIGKTILDGYGQISYGDFLNCPLALEDRRVETEEKIIGISHDDIGVYYCAAWNLPAPLLWAIKFHHQRFGHVDMPGEARRLTAIVSLSNFLAWTQGLGSADRIFHPDLQPEVDLYLDLDGLEFQELIERMDLEIRRTEHLYQFKFPTPEQMRLNLIRASIELARSGNRGGFTDIPRQEGPCPRTPNRVLINQTLETLHREFGFDRVTLFRINRNQRSLEQVHGIDFTGNGSGAENRSILLSRKSTLVINSLRKVRPVILKDSDPPAKEILAGFKAGEIGFLPFAYQNQLSGVLVVDNYHSRSPLSLSRIQELSVLVRELGKSVVPAFSPDPGIPDIDPVTKLYGRQTMENRLKEICSQVPGKGPGCHAGIIEIDRFPEFVRAFGVLEGESIQKLVADILSRHTRASDPVGRYDPERFMVILNRTGPERAQTYGKRMCKRVEELGLVLTRRFSGHPVTLSMGMASREKGFDARDILEQAFSALARARAGGGNQSLIR